MVDGRSWQRLAIRIIALQGVFVTLATASARPIPFEFSRPMSAAFAIRAVGLAFLAYVFSSAGPLFTGRYDLAVAPQSVRVPAEFLWANYTQKGALLGGGISAFPSLHVAIATWFALVLRDRGFPRLGLAYALAVFACSVVLGWHYAADGVGGAIIALVAYRLAGVLVRRPGQAVALVARPTPVTN
jgi:membrane-associated phospholipid phosphatase